jgi:AraC family transcriptional regulator
MLSSKFEPGRKPAHPRSSELAVQTSSSKQSYGIMQYSVRATSDGRMWNGFEAFTCDGSGGIAERPPSLAHRVTMHLSHPVQTTCAIGGPPVRGVIGPGALFVVPIGYPSSWIDEGPCRIVSANMSHALICSVAAEIGASPDGISIAPRVLLHDPILEHLSWALAAELEGPDRHDPFFGESLANAMAIHLVRRYSAVRSVRLQRRLSRRQLDAVVEYINSSLASALSLSKLAGVAGVSQSYFAALFKRTTGVSVHQYVMRCRVEHAMRMLSYSNVRLAEVAQDAGFTDQSHMARCMRRLIGMTPASFSRLFREQPLRNDSFEEHD